MKRILGLLLLAALVSVGTLSAQSIRLTGSDDAAAARQLADWLKSNGVAAELTSSGTTVRYKDTFTILLSPKLSDSGLDRIVANTYFSFEDAYKGNPETSRILEEVNRKYNIAAFCIDNDGDLQIRTYLTFFDTMDLAEIKAFLDWYDTSLLSVIMSTESLQRILK